jgi:tripartite-type tricarboxylate transporter receptor subunit TctC
LPSRRGARVAVTTPRRSPSAPELPTIRKRCRVARLPHGRACSRRLECAADRRPARQRREAILERPDVATQLAAVGAEPAPLPPDEFAAFARAERAKWKEVVRNSGARID